MPVDPRQTDERTDERPAGVPSADPDDMAREVAEPGSVDPHRPIPQTEPGGGAAPGGLTEAAEETPPR
jgi:hypothetical protein